MAEIMRQVSWLHLSGLPKEVQTMVEDLPFKGPKLFTDMTGTSLHALKVSLGIYTAGQKRRAMALNHSRGHDLLSIHPHSAITSCSAKGPGYLPLHRSTQTSEWVHPTEHAYLSRLTTWDAECDNQQSKSELLSQPQLETELRGAS